ncbi:MAG: hypothetical protein KAH32_05980 [Chlamydiia bacterium]|nr:hypothetical protein [Chlamydiia bacterium]
MFVPEFKPPIYLDSIEVDNISIDKEVFFIEEGHHYFHKEDIDGNTVTNFTDSKYKFRSPTGILSAFKEHFDSVGISERYVVKHDLDITAEELRAEWSEKARIASDRGSKLHAYCESIYDGWDFGEIPEEPQARQAEYALQLLDKAGWKLMKTELLVYNKKLRLAGQVDLLLKIKHEGKVFLGIFDYKFLKEPIQKKSYYNKWAGGYKMMSGPFRHLMDCNYYHYSIQMELYRMLMGVHGKKVKKKTLVVMVEDDYDFVDGYPMKIWVDSDGDLQAKYKKFDGEIFDSSKDAIYNENPYKVI